MPGLRKKFLGPSGLSLRTADAFPVGASLPPKREKRRPEMLFFAGREATTGNASAVRRLFGPQFGLKISGGGGPGPLYPFPRSATDKRVKKLDLEAEPPRIKVTLSTRPSP